MLETKNAHAIRMAARAHGRPFVRDFFWHTRCISIAQKPGRSSTDIFQKIWHKLCNGRAGKKIRAPPSCRSKAIEVFSRSFRDFSRLHNGIITTLGVIMKWVIAKNNGFFFFLVKTQLERENFRIVLQYWSIVTVLMYKN